MTLVRKVQKARLGFLVRWDPMAPKVILVRREIPDQPDLLVQKGTTVVQGSQVFQGKKGHQVLLGKMEEMANLV